MSKESVYFKLGDAVGKRGVKELKSELDSFPGVISVSVNTEKNSVAVDFDNTGVKAGEIANRIRKLGCNIEAQKSEEHIM